jgi:hypothetical protein
MKKLELLVIAGVLLLPTYAAAQPTRHPPNMAAQVRARPPFVIGYLVATRRGYSPQQRRCYARVFARHAYPHPETGWNATLSPGYRGDMWNQCRLSF